MSAAVPAVFEAVKVDYAAIAPCWSSSVAH